MYSKNFILQTVEKHWRLKFYFFIQTLLLSMSYPETASERSKSKPNSTLRDKSRGANSFLFQILNRLSTSTRPDCWRVWDLPPPRKESQKIGKYKKNYFTDRITVNLYPYKACFFRLVKIYYDIINTTDIC